MRRATIIDGCRAGLASLRRAGPSLPRLSRWAWAADVIIAVALAAGAVNGALSRGDQLNVMSTPDLPVVPTGVPVPPVPPVSILHPYAGAAPWQVVLAALTALPLLFRRRYPLWTFWAVIAATQLYHVSPGLDPTFTFTACVIAAYSAAMYSPYRVLAIGSALVGAGLIIGDEQANVPSIRPGLVTFLFLIPVALAANAIHTWQQRVHALQADSEAATRLAVQQERARLAHELHDVVTHNVSVMVVQAGAARTVMDSSPEQARRALLAVESGGRAAMTELRHVMGLLATDGDPPDEASAGLVPPPGVGEVAALVARMRGTGVRVELTVTGTPVPLRAGVDLAAYRVVQEGLTNAVKHAAGADVRLTLGYAPGALEIEVADTGGTPRPPAGSGSGRGLIGLRQRLAVYGGTLQAGQQPAGGYVLRATIPLEQE